jgi:serine/threonine protein kinase
MATVYKAYQASMDRYVALKVLPQYHSEDPSFTQRFIQEARTIARLEHRNILPVYDFGEEDGVAYMAMRYLDGGTLQDILALGELPLNETIEILRQICAGLDYAHRQGVVHRDVKPANVMIDGEGGVYLTDFGLAKVLEGSSNLTMSGMVMGTPLYMAPEQSVGEGIDGRADIYAAGVILYEMVTGQPPFQAETPMAIVLAHLHEPLPLPKEINPAVPDEIQRVILKALAKDPEDRYQTAREMSEQLSEVSTATDTTNNTPTLQFLATEARNSLEEKVILPTDKNFTPVSAKTGIPVAAPAARG